MSSSLYLGSRRALSGAPPSSQFDLPSQHLVTHGAILGMTGSGKTGLLMVLIEEALRAGVPVLMVDVKGDLSNLALAFAGHDPAPFASWLDPDDPRCAGQSLDRAAAQLADERRASLAQWNIEDHHLASFARGHTLRVLTPGSTAGESVHIFSSLERRDHRWDSDPDAARASLSAALSLALRLVDRDPDPASSREHVLLSVLAERRLLAGTPASLEALLSDLESPPVETIGALSVDKFYSKKSRGDLAASLNALLASPSFRAWREGASLAPGEWLAPPSLATSPTPATLFSVAHLDDEERALVLGVMLEELLSWVRSLPGRSSLRALVVFDEVYGFLPPHPANPPTRRPLTALLKQARAFGVGTLVATQNPMDLDYRALSNTGLWCIGRLQTDADRERVIDGLSASDDRESAKKLAHTIKKLPPRWFVTRDVHLSSEAFLLHTRHTMSWLRGPLTPAELRRVRGPGGAQSG